MSFSIFVRHQWNEEFETLLTNSPVLRDFLFIAILYNEISTSVVTISTVKQTMNILKYIYKNCFNNNSTGQLTMFQIQFHRGIMGGGGVKTSIINLEVLYCVLPVFVPLVFRLLIFVLLVFACSFRSPDILFAHTCSSYFFNYFCIPPRWCLARMSRIIRFKLRKAGGPHRNYWGTKGGVGLETFKKHLWTLNKLFKWSNYGKLATR